MVNQRALARWWVAGILLFSFATAGAETPETAEKTVRSGTAKPNLKSLSNDVREYLRKSLEDPAKLNKVLDSYLAKDSGLAFLKDINFRFKAFEAREPNTQTSIGFSYDYGKSILNGEWGQGCGDTCARGYDFNFSARGNVAFDPDRNPDDFLETRLSLSLFQSLGGIAKELSAEGKQQYNELTLKAAQAKDERELENVYADILRLIAGTFSNQYYVDLSGDFALESNQSFSAKQYAYGLRLGLDVKGWERSNAERWNETSWLAKLNLIDYPFALLRMLTGYEKCKGGASCFLPRATHWPTVSIALARITPEDNDPRLAVGETSDYDRLAGEVSFKTPIARIAGEKIFFSANHRLYQELNASTALRASGLDHYRYTTLAIGAVTGPYVSYTDGRLPLDARNDQVFELGYQSHF